MVIFVMYVWTSTYSVPRTGPPRPGTLSAGVFGYGTLHLAKLDPWGLIKPGIPGLDDIVNLLGRGLYSADAVNTVSNRYAEEILTAEYG